MATFTVERRGAAHPGEEAEQEAERAEALRLEINERLGEQARRRREQLERLGLA